MSKDRADLASVIVVVQACLSLVSGLSAIPFGLVEPGFRLLALVTLGAAAAMFWLARSLRRRRDWARRWVIGLEAASLLGSLLLAGLPIGAMRGPVPLLINLGLPLTVLVLLLARTPGAQQPGPPLASLSSASGPSRTGRRRLPG